MYFYIKNMIVVEASCFVESIGTNVLLVHNIFRGTYYIIACINDKYFYSNSLTYYPKIGVDYIIYAMENKLISIIDYGRHYKHFYYYININGHHMIDYKKFVNIQQISKINEDDIKIKNIYVGDIILYNCDIDIVHKALDVMARFMNDKKSFVIDLMYHIFH